MNPALSRSVRVAGAQDRRSLLTSCRDRLQLSPLSLKRGVGGKGSRLTTSSRLRSSRSQDDVARVKGVAEPKPQRLWPNNASPPTWNILIPQSFFANEHILPTDHIEHPQLTPLSRGRGAGGEGNRVTPTSRLRPSQHQNHLSTAKERATPEPQTTWPRSASPRTRILFVAQILLIFLTLRTSLATAQDNAYDGTEYYEPPVVRNAANDVLDSPEFRTLPRLNLGPDGKLKDPLKKKEEAEPEQRSVRVPSSQPSLFSSLFGGVVSLGVFIVLVLVLGGIIALIVLGLRHWERREKESAEPETDATSDDDPETLITPGTKSADAWLAAARRAATEGRYDEAIALLLIGSMGHAERAGFIKPRRGLTYRDYLRAVPSTSAWHATLDRLIRAYAPIGFGRREATAESFQQLVEPYEASLAAEPAPSSNDPAVDTHLLSLSSP